jgi:putative ABC transport system permease protein
MIGVINMILVNIFDKRKEIGTYYCIGAEKSLLTSMYACEILIINVIATVVGMLLGIGLQVIINTLKLSSTNPGIQLVFGGNIFHMVYNFSSVVMLFISVIVITLVISLIALRKSLKVPPRVALLETEE